MHERGIPKDMAAELYKPFVIRKLIERGIVKTVKSAKKIIDRKAVSYTHLPASFKAAMSTSSCPLRECDIAAA